MTYGIALGAFLGSLLGASAGFRGWTPLDPFYALADFLRDPSGAKRRSAWLAATALAAEKYTAGVRAR